MEVTICPYGGSLAVEYVMPEANPAEDVLPARTPGHAKAVLLLLFAAVVFSAWAAIEYLHVTYLQHYISMIKSNLSVARLAILAGFTGFLASLPILRRRRPRRVDASLVKSDPQIFSPNRRVHPLMMRPRPARDSTFIIRKTRNRGRISRNRDGERLPPTHTD